MRMRCMQGFLVQLRQDDDEVVQLEALSQLNELLSISNEESLSVFPVEQLVPVLVRIDPESPAPWSACNPSQAADLPLNCLFMVCRRTSVAKMLLNMVPSSQCPLAIKSHPPR